MPDERDKRRLLTPPEGVRAQIAGPVTEDFHSLTPTHPTPVEQPTVDETSIARIERHGAENKNLATTTLSGIAELREETNKKFDKVHEKIDAQAEVLSDVRAMAAESVGQNVVMLEMLRAQNTAKAQSGEIRVVRETMTAEVHGARAKSEIEVAKAEKLADIDAEKATHAAKVEVAKTIALKVIAGVTALAGAIAAGIGIGQCGQ